MKQEKIAQGRFNSSVTLVPFAGISLIRFRGSRINGLSPRVQALGTPTRKIPLRRGANGCKLLVND